jgi:peptidyl-prolyl cis-trans isomerase B (cyclophilin B)
MLVIKTNHGEIKIQLDFERTPITAQSFLDYVKAGHFDGTIFHRVIDNFMIQGGGFDVDMNQKETRETIENEADKGGANKRGTLAMARTGDPHSASAQFFINVKDNDFLNFSSKTTNGWGYCVFGEVVEGLDIVDAIRKVPTTSRMGHDDVPVDEVIIESVTEFLTENA